MQKKNSVCSFFFLCILSIWVFSGQTIFWTQKFLGKENCFDQTFQACKCWGRRAHLRRHSWSLGQAIPWSRSKVFSFDHDWLHIHYQLESTWTGTSSGNLTWIKICVFPHFHCKVGLLHSKFILCSVVLVE